MAAWLGAFAGARHAGVAAALAAGGITLALLRPTAARVSIAVVVVGAIVSGAVGAAADRPPAVFAPAGRLTVAGVALGDPTGVAGTRRLVIGADRVLDGTVWTGWTGPRLAVVGDVEGIAAGEPVVVAGVARPAAFRTRSGWVGGVLQADEVIRVGEADGALDRIANRLRRRVLAGLGDAARVPERALLAGFLIGEVGALPAADVEALRLAGLSHFVAVSGSNVALFLGAWWLVSGPLAWRPRRRALTGLLGLAVFVVATRAEPSVVRAAAMAAIVLAGRLVGREVAPGAALGWAVTGLLVVDGLLATEVGFQLSVAATAGILAGLPRWRGRRPIWAWAPVGASVSAQVAVAPLLLVHFGTVPLLAPVTNLVSAPLVTVATALAGIGSLLGSDRVVGTGAFLAGIVLRVARGAADLPQLGTAAVTLVGGLALLAVAWRPLRPVMAVVAAGALLVAMSPVRPPGGPAVSFLDVGQGDAILLRGPGGEVILVDGGPDPAVLRDHLRRAGVRRIDLLVVSHLHADHVGGLVGLRVPVARLWHPPQAGEGPPFDLVLAEQVAAGTLVEVPPVGTVAAVGSFVAEVLGPRRRYASPNDGSMVLRVTASGTVVVLPGDIEAIAQADLGPLPADVLKVPHQGAATSDLDWLAASAPAVAVVSVGRNDFGHPSAAVIGRLEEAGARVLRTDRDGTVTLRLDRLVGALPSPR